MTYNPSSFFARINSKKRATGRVVPSAASTLGGGPLHPKYENLLPYF